MSAPGWPLRLSGAGKAALAARILQVSIPVITLAFIPGHALGPDQFAFPKELALFATALATLAVCFHHASVRVARVDLLLLALPALGALSLVEATNRWDAVRALGICLSGVVLFWVASHLAQRGCGERLLHAIVLAAALAAGLALLEAYGVVPDLSSGRRTPGGPIGNRNYLAELLAIGFPVLLYVHARAAGWRAAAALLAASLLGAVLTLTRARGAWLATCAAFGTVIAVRVACAEALRRALPLARLGALIVATVVGIALAVVLPNALGWSSATPYASSVRRIAEWDAGSGRGRVLQYGNTIRMIRENPVLGVGPGNWHIMYPRFAPSDDPSIDAFGAAPTTRFPQSDWLGFASEFGVLAMLVAASSGFLLLRQALSALRAPRREGRDGEMLGAATLCGVLAALLTAGAFDAVLLQATPLATSAVAVGVLAAPLAPRRVLPRRPLRWGRTLIGIALGAGVLFASRQLAAGYLVSTMDVPAGHIAASRVNPADYQLNAWLAEYWIRSRSCPRSMPYIRAAQKLFPTAPQPVRLERQCRLLM